MMATAYTYSLEAYKIEIVIKESAFMNNLQWRSARQDY